MAATIDATPANVAALLRARTKDAGGRELGEWTDETRPTLAQVDEALALAQGVVEARVGAPLDACASAFNVAVVFEAACMIEKSLLPRAGRIGPLALRPIARRGRRDARGRQACQTGNDPADGRRRAHVRVRRVHAARRRLPARPAGRPTSGNATSKTRCHDRRDRHRRGQAPRRPARHGRGRAGPRARARPAERAAPPSRSPAYRAARAGRLRKAIVSSANRA